VAINTTNQELIDQAIMGDGDAIAQLLWDHYDRLFLAIAAKLPVSYGAMSKRKTYCRRRFLMPGVISVIWTDCQLRQLRKQ